jgi:hypothetical protein
MDATDDQRAILTVLLEARPRMVGLEELRTVEGVDYAEEAVHHLREDGVVVRLGDLVGVSRAAVRYGELMLRT